MLELTIPQSGVDYKLDSVYIFNYGKVEILATFIRFDKGYNVFETSQSTYKHVLDCKLVPSRHKVHIIREDYSGVIVKEEINFKDILITYLNN